MREQKQSSQNDNIFEIRNVYLKPSTNEQKSIERKYFIIVRLQLTTIFLAFGLQNISILEHGTSCYHKVSCFV